ncbi:MAG TPA: GTPase Era [Firmicutes bacterium]|nr:GTPase Era [Bacillota bacterium]
MFHSGFVSVIGRPNVGKSTLINTLLGRKALIVSDKPQTTRNRIQAIYTSENFQIVFLDTPGIHKPRHLLGDYMLKSALDALQEVDLILFMVEATSSPGPGDRYIADLLRSIDTPKFLVVNKIDLIADGVEERLRLYKQLGEFKEAFTISALEEKNVRQLLEGIFAMLPEGPRYYPPETVIDRPQDFLAAEIIREKILQLTREEIPHSVAVEIEEMYLRDSKLTDNRSQMGRRGAMLQENLASTHLVENVTKDNTSENGFPANTGKRSRISGQHKLHSPTKSQKELLQKELLVIGAVIYVEKESQKRIIIGKKGGMLKEIGTEARLELEKIFGNPIFLDLWVKVKKDWRQKEHNLRQFGYE